MIKIGNLVLKNTVFLAPMAGVTDLSFRLTCRKFGCGLAYTEMICSKALYYQDKKTRVLLRTCEEDTPLAIQIFGSDPAIMRATLPDILAYKPALIDINMGCPAPKIVGNGEGSFLMTQPKLAAQIVREVKKVSTVPVTVKIRKGFIENNAVEMAKILEDAGADAIAVHPRTRQEYYRDHSDWQVIADVKRAVSIPVIGNGDILTGEDVARMYKQTGCDAVMIGRGAQGNPFIFREINEYLKDGFVHTKVTNEERVKTAIEQIRLLVEDKGEHMGILQSRKHAAWYMRGMRGSTAAKNAVNHATTLREMEVVLQSLI